MTMSERGPTVIVDWSTNKICVCPSGPVVMCSLKTTSCPSTSRRGAAPGGIPVACGLTALLTRRCCWATDGAQASPVPNSKAANMTARNGRGAAEVIELSSKPDLRPDQNRGVVVRVERQVRRDDIALQLCHDGDRGRNRPCLSYAKSPTLRQLGAEAVGIDTGKRVAAGISTRVRGCVIAPGATDKGRSLPRIGGKAGRILVADTVGARYRIGRVRIEGQLRQLIEIIELQVQNSILGDRFGCRKGDKLVIAAEARRQRTVGRVGIILVPKFESRFQSQVVPDDLIIFDPGTPGGEVLVPPQPYLVADNVGLQ